jgi:ribose transport system permease protein
LNGFFVVIVGVDALVATLGTGTLITGVGFAVSDYQIIGGVSETLTSAVSERFLGLPLSFYYGLGLCIVMWYIFRYTPLGRHLLFVGAGQEVARLSGLRVQAIRVGAFVACGLIAAIAGVMFAGILGAADPNAGINFLLPAYAAAFLGATAVNPGQFNPWGSFIAVYFLVTGVTGLQLLGLEDWIQQVFYGAVLVAAVTLSRIASRKRA